MPKRDQLADHEAPIEKMKQGLSDLEALLEQLQEETEEEGTEESTPERSLRLVVWGM